MKYSCLNTKRTRRKSKCFGGNIPPNSGFSRDPEFPRRAFGFFGFVREKVRRANLVRRKKRLTKLPAFGPPHQKRAKPGFGIDPFTPSKSGVNLPMGENN
jgi:hypothetical protein